MHPREISFVIWGHCQNLLDDPRTFVKNGVLQSRQCVHRSWIFGLFDSIVIRFDLEQNHFDINLGNNN